MIYWQSARCYLKWKSSESNWLRRSRCILLKFYIKPQLVRNYYSFSQCCILLKFYIKPQLVRTKNSRRLSCILLKFYIKPQLTDVASINPPSCILLKFYIKPQLHCAIRSPRRVVSYWNSTSNHNSQSYYFREPGVVSYWNSTSNHNVGSVICW